MGNKELYTEIPEKCSILDDICNQDHQLRDYLKSFLYVNPIAVISKIPVDTLIEQAKVSGNFRSAEDKAVFEGSQHPAEKDKYVRMIQDISAMAITSMTHLREAAAQSGNNDEMVLYDRRLSDQRLLGEKASEIIDIAADYYAEKMHESDESAERDVILKRHIADDESEQRQMLAAQDRKEEAKKRKKSDG